MMKFIMLYQDVVNMKESLNKKIEPTQVYYNIDIQSFEKSVSRKER